MTVLAPSAGNVEAESSAAVTACLALGKACKEVPDMAPDLDVCGRVGAWSLAYRTLVYLNQLVQVFGPFDGPIAVESLIFLIEPVSQGRRQYLIEQRALAASGDSGKHDELAQGEVEINIVEIVLGSSDDLQMLAVSGPSEERDRYLNFAGKELSGDALRVLLDLLGSTLGYYEASTFPCSRAHVHDIVCTSDRGLVMLYHKHGIAQVPEVLESIDQSLVVPLMQADGRLVEDIQHSAERRSDLGCKTDSLSFPSAECTCAAAEGQIAESHVLEECESCLDFLHYLVGNLALVLREVQAQEEIIAVADVHGGSLVDVLAAYKYAQGLRSQFLAMADGTLDLGLEGIDPGPDGNALRFRIAALEVVDYSVPASVDAHASHPVLIVHLELGSGPVENRIELLWSELVERGLDGKAVALGEGLESGPSPAGVGVLAGNCTFIETLCSIRNYLADIILCLKTKSIAFGTGSEGIVEGEKPGLDLTDGDSAVRAAVLLRVDFRTLCLVLGDICDFNKATCHIGGLLNGIGESQACGFLQNQTVNDYADGVLHLLVQGKALVQHMHLTIDADPLITCLLCILKNLFVFALSTQGHRCHDHDSGAISTTAVDGLDYLVN